MDPIANLKEQRELAQEIINLIDEPSNTPDDSDTLAPDIAQQIAQLADRLAELVIALDAWRNMGGFDPYTTKEN